MVALTGVARLSVSLVEYFDSAGTQESLFEKRTVFVEKLSVSKFSLMRPDAGESPWAEHGGNARDASVAAVHSPMQPPRWQRALVTTAFWHSTNFV